MFLLTGQRIHHSKAIYRKSSRCADSSSALLGIKGDYRLCRCANLS